MPGSALVSGHQDEHFLDCLLNSDADGSADNAVSDVQFDQVGHAVQEVQVRVVEAVTGIDLQSEGMCPLRRRRETSEFPVDLTSKSGRFGKRTRVKLDELCSHPGGGFHLENVRVDEQAHLNARLFEAG